MTVTDTRPDAAAPEPAPAPAPASSASGGDPPGGHRHHDVNGTLWRRLAFAMIPLALIAGYLIGDRGTGGGSAGPSQAGVLAELKSTLGSDKAVPVADRGFSKLENGVQHSHAFELPISDADRALLAHQMDVARQTALQYPTVADAERAGLRRAGPFSPGLGAHYVAYGNYRYGAGKAVMTDEQIRHPIAWIYDGTKPTSRISGLFYNGVVPKPAGFAGPNDVWHEHTNICLTQAKDGGVDAPLGADRDATKAQCDAVGGNLITATGPLLHLWVVPGYEDAQGVYAHLNPGITCDDGTYRIVDVSKLGTRTSACVDGTE